MLWFGVQKAVFVSKKPRPRNRDFGHDSWNQLQIKLKWVNCCHECKLMCEFLSIQCSSHNRLKYIWQFKWLTQGIDSKCKSDHSRTSRNWPLYPKCRDLVSLTGGGRLQESNHWGSLSKRLFRTHLLYGRQFIACNFWVAILWCVVSHAKSSSYILSSIVHTANIEISGRLRGRLYLFITFYG